VTRSSDRPGSLLGQLVKFWNNPPHYKHKALRDLAERKRVLEPIMRLRTRVVFSSRRLRPRRHHGLSHPLIVSLTS
jgi:hypothetical protein